MHAIRRDSPRLDGDSPLSVAGNIIGILTFIYALIVGGWYFLGVYKRAPDDMFDLLQIFEDEFGEVMTQVHRFGNEKDGWREPGDTILNLRETFLENAFREMFKQANDTAGEIGRLAHLLGIASVDVAGRGQATDDSSALASPQKVETRNMNLVIVRVAFNPLYERRHRFSERIKYLAKEGDLRNELRKLKLATTKFKRLICDFIPNVYAQDHERNFQQEVLEQLQRLAEAPNRLNTTHHGIALQDQIITHTV